MFINGSKKIIMLKLIKILNVTKVLIQLSVHSIFNSFVDIFIFYGIGKLLLDDNEEKIFLFLIQMI